jgi:uncharacterized cupredoxin-like copper-binding protein
MVGPLFIVAIAAAPGAWADSGHSHGPQGKGVYDGHAAALGEPAPPRARVNRTIIVVANDEMRFSPSTLTIAKGETVRIEVRNTGKLKHEMVLGTPEELTAHAALMQKFPEMEHVDPNAVTVEAGKTKSLVWKFTKAGTFEIGFACLVPGHFEGGMKGRIIVR